MRNPLSWCLQLCKALLCLGLLWLAPAAYAAVTANITVTGYAAFQLQNPGKNANMPVLLLQSATNNHLNTRTTVWSPTFTSDTTKTNASLPAGYYTVVAYHTQYGEATGCNESPINGSTFAYYPDGSTINITIDCPMPDLTSATPASATTNVTGDQVVVTFDELISDNYTDGSHWTVKANSSSIPVTAVDITYSDNDVTLTLGSNIAVGQTVTVSFTGGELYDGAYNETDPFTDFPVTNAVVSAGVALGTNPTLTFSAQDNAAFTDGVAEDGDGGSQEISDLDLQIYNISSSTGTALAVLAYKTPAQLANSSSFGGLTDNFNYGSGWKGMALKSADGSEFKLNSFNFYDWGNADGRAYSVVGLRNGSQVATTSFGSNSTSSHISVSLPATFANVDEVRIYGAFSANFPSINTISLSPPVATSTATVSTGAASSVGLAAATLNGDVTSDGGATVTARGFVYSSSDNTPQIGEGGVTNLADGSGTGSFSEVLSSLTAGTTFYYQAYATNSEGTSYGGVQSFSTTAPSVSLSASPLSIAENGGSSTVTATLNAAAGSNVSVTLAASGTATGAGTDYSLSSTTITIAAGSLSGTATVSAVNDALDEADETVIVDISGVTGGGGAAENGNQQVTITITDDDPTPSLSVADASQVEGNSGTSVVAFNVSLSAASGKTVTVDYATADGTATTADSDYVSAAGTLTFSSGETSKTVNVTINGDSKAESDETFSLVLSNASNATLSDNSATGTILSDDDALAPTVSSITRLDPATATTSADTLRWTVTFSESVTNVDAADFSVSGSSATVTAVSSVNGSTYEVTVSGGDLASYNGTVSLGFAGGQDIEDVAGNALSSTVVTGVNESSYQLDNQGPQISALSLPNSALKIGDVVTVTISVTADTDSFSLVSGTVAGFTLGNLTRVNDSTYTATFTIAEGTDVAGVTDLPVSLVLKDSYDNESATYNTAISQIGDSIDASRPYIASATRLMPLEAETNADQVSWQLVFSEAVTGFSAADINVRDTTATISSLTSNDGITWTLVASGGDLPSLTGMIYLSMANGYSITDLAGNAMTDQTAGSYLSNSQSYHIDNTAPMTPYNLGLETASDCGVSNTDRKTNDNTPTVLGKTDTFGVALVELFRDGNVLVGSTTELDCGAWGVTSSVLSDGTHQLTAIAKDAAGNVSGTSAALEVLIDTVAPTASVSAPAVTQNADGETSYSFTVTYSDSGSGADSSSFDGDDINVTGPGAYNAAATLVSVNGNIATYSITPPGGSWDLADVGSYSIALNGNQVADVAGNFASANAAVGSFAVSYNAAPVNSVAPAVNGTRKVGNALSASTGSWTDSDGGTLTYSYQWFRADDAAGSNSSAISGAVTASLSLSVADAHKYVRVVVTVDDGQGSADQSAASVWSGVENTVPVNSNIPAVSGTASTGSILTTGNGSWTDADNDTLSYSYQWYSATDAAGSGATAIGGATGASLTLTSAQAHRYIRVVVTAADGYTGSAEAGSGWTLVGNTAPVNNTVPAISGAGAVGNTLSASNGSWTDADDDSLTYSYQWFRATDSSGSGATAIGNATGSSYLIGSVDSRRFLRVTVSVSDGNGGSLSANSNWLEVTNSAPQLTGTPATTIDQGQAYSFVPQVTDADLDTLTFSISNKPAWLNFNTSTGELSGTPDNAAVGVYDNIVMSVSDGTETASLPAFSLTVVNVNDAPQIGGIAPTAVAQGEQYLFIPDATDVDAETTLTFSISNKPAWLNFNSSTGELSGTPANTDIGVYSNIVISVSDGLLTVSMPAFSITVNNTNDAPVISGTPPVSVAQGSLYSFTPTASDIDAGTTLIFSISNKPAWLSFNTSTGELSGTPDNAAVGVYNNIVISVSDGSETASLPAFNLTVTNVNDAPELGGVPSTRVLANTPYLFVPQVSDIDGDSLTFSISNKPAWATFDSSNGRLAGTPTSNDVGVTSGVLISVSDGTVTVSLPAFDLEVLSDNSAPVARDSALSLDEDQSLLITPDVSDADQDPLQFEIVQPPEHGSLLQEGQQLRYMPLKDFNGEDSFVFVANDGNLSSAPATVRLTVRPVNDNPLAQPDVYTLAQSADDIYNLAVLANDSDVDGDTLQIDGASASTGTVQATATGLRYQAPVGYVGAVSLRYTLTDGQGGRASADVQLTISGSNAADLPQITVPADVEVNAVALYTKVDLGVATATDRNGQALPVSLVNGNTFFAPGEHLAYWKATDAQGNSNTKAQRVRVKPLISLSKDATVTEGSAVRVQVLLNGPSPVYPLVVPYTVSGTANGQDHDLVSGEVVIQSGTSAELAVQIFSDNLTEGSETIVIELDSRLNRGAKAVTTLNIAEDNVAPQASLSVQQQGKARLEVSQAEGKVTVTADATDANSGDQLSLNWQTGELRDVSISGAVLEFDAAAQAPGVYPVRVQVADNGTPVLSTSADVYIVVRASLPTLTDADSDGDLIPDDQEGFADSDGDGIPDYLDAIADCNVVPEVGGEQVRFLAEGEPGVCLRRGQGSVLSETGGLQILTAEISTDPAARNIGGMFDFIAYGLPVAGQSYQLVLPQVLPVPANALYRKLGSDGNWRDFVIDSRNQVSSTRGERGFCPPPGAAQWQPGLTEGDWCVQVTIEDGGPNDDDGVANNAIVDPGGVAVALSNNQLPQAQADTAATRTGVAVEVNVLANDTDADGDLLSISQASAQFGQVQIVAGQKLLYTPAAGFFGQDLVIYSVTDGKGGTGSSELRVTVQPNRQPVAVDDSASTDDKTSIIIKLLANDTDPDGDSLKLISVTANQGTTAVQGDNSVRYTPKAGFNGVDTLTYLIEDAYGARAQGSAKVTVTAYQTVVVDNRSSGGAAGGWLALLLPLLWLRRATLAAGLLCMPLVSQASDWYGFVEAGQSSADRDSAALSSQSGATVLALDDKDQSIGVGVGYQWTPQLAVELSWRDYGEASVQLQQSSLTPAQYHAQVRAVSPYLGDAVGLGLRWSAWQHDGWRFDVSAGMQRWQTEVQSTMGTSTLQSDFDGTDLYYGVALGYQLTEQFSAAVQWQRGEVHTNDVDTVALRLQWRF